MSGTVDSPRARREKGLALIETLTVGLPFCAFKILTGLWLLRTSWGAPLGFGLVALGAFDALLNGSNAALLLVRGWRPVPLCTLHLLARRLRPGQLAFAEAGLGIDMLLSFSLVAGMVGLGLIGTLPGRQLAVWNAAVVANVLGAGVLRLAQGLRGA